MELSQIADARRDEFPAAIVFAAAASRGPSAALLMRLLDEIDHGLVLVDGSGALRYANQLGHQELASDRPLALLDERVQARHLSDQAALNIALADALRGRRRLFNLGRNGSSSAIAAVPIGADANAAEALVLLVFGKRPAGATLTADFFARGHGLTSAETQVLKRICDGMKPKEIARENSVAISTVRSHICSIRIKTQTASIRDLVNRVALLPPMTPAVKTVPRASVH